MQILLCRSNTLGSWLIRALTWSSWSHAAIVNGYECVEATWPRVRQVDTLQVVTAHSDFVLIDLPCVNPSAAWEAAISQVGKPYDWLALAGFLVHRDWAATGRWFCSELVAWSFFKAGSPLYRPEDTHRVTPEMLWLLPPTSTPTKGA